MEPENHSMRFIMEDLEGFISWAPGTDRETVKQVLIYINDIIRKKYAVDRVVYKTSKDIEGTEYSLDTLFEREISPAFILIPDRPEIKTTNDIAPRTTKHVYNIIGDNVIKIQKYENMKKFEDVEMKVPVIKTLNEANKKRSFKAENLKLLDKQRIVNQVGGKVDAINNPLNFVSHEDLSQRQKVPLADGKSQYAFMKLAEAGPDESPRKKTELKAYTLDDVKKHNKRQDAWIVIDDKIYDITNYLPFHPGGDKLLAGVGRDGTEMFNQYHAWVNAHFLLAKFQVGYLKKSAY